MTNSISIYEINRLQSLLKYVYGLVPIVAGLDKFFNLLTTWEDYMPSFLIQMLPFEPSVFMMIIGVIEVLAGLIVLLRTEIGAYIVAAWLILIALNLILTGEYFDVAVRDLVMAVGAYVLARLTQLQSGHQK